MRKENLTVQFELSKKRKKGKHLNCQVMSTKFRAQELNHEFWLENLINTPKAHSPITLATDMGVEKNKGTNPDCQFPPSLLNKPHFKLTQLSTSEHIKLDNNLSF